MEEWRDATSRQVKVLTGRLNELLSGGLELVRSELGLDLGPEPVPIPPWVLLSAACVGLVLMAALWASACRCIFKKRSAVADDDDGVGVKAGAAKPAAKSDEQRRRKKKAEKKVQTAQPNGRAVGEPQDEALVSEEFVPHHQPPSPDSKTEKATEVKKSKKKTKQGAKDTKTAAAVGREPEEGTWETKVSNKEKREQRKKDKAPSDGSASPGGGNTPNGAPPEQTKATVAPTPTNQKKKKAEPSKVKADKSEAATPQVSSTEAVRGVAEKVIKVPSHPFSQAPGRWTATREPASLWGTEIDGSWTVIESNMKTSDLNLLSFSGLGVGSNEPQPVPDLPWLGQPQVDECSGLNGNSADPTSDWDAPSEAWGNYEERTPEPPTAAQKVTLPGPAKVKLLIEVADEDDDEKEKAETTADSMAIAKRKKKKKKRKTVEVGPGVQEVEEPEKVAAPDALVKKKKKQQPAQAPVPPVQPVKVVAEMRGERPKETASQKPPVTQVPQKPAVGDPTAERNDLPAPATQKNLDENQASKPAKKKKARRET